MIRHHRKNRKEKQSKCEEPDSVSNGERQE